MLIYFVTDTEIIYTLGLPNLTKYFSIDSGITQIASTSYFLCSWYIIVLQIIGCLWQKTYSFIRAFLFMLHLQLLAFLVSIEILMIVPFVRAFSTSIGSVVGEAMARDSYQG